MASRWLAVGRGAPSTKSRSSGPTGRGGGRSFGGPKRGRASANTPSQDEADGEEEEEEEEEENEEEMGFVQAQGGYPKAPGAQPRGMQRSVVAAQPRGSQQRGSQRNQVGNPQGAPSTANKKEMGGFQAQLNSLKSEVTSQKVVIVSLDKSVKDIEGHLNTVAFFPEGSSWGDPLLDQANGWRQAVRQGRERDLIGPVQHIGATLVGLTLTMIEEDEKQAPEDKLIPTVQYLSEEMLAEWRQEHISMAPEDLHHSLDLIQVISKGPRWRNGAPLPGDPNRVMLKVRATKHFTALWPPVMKLLEFVAVRDGGYVAGKQPTQAKVKAMEESLRKGNATQRRRK